MRAPPGDSSDCRPLLAIDRRRNAARRGRRSADGYLGREGELASRGNHSRLVTRGQVKGVRQRGDGPPAENTRYGTESSHGAGPSAWDSRGKDSRLCRIVRRTPRTHGVRGVPVDPATPPCPLIDLSSPPNETAA